MSRAHKWKPRHYLEKEKEYLVEIFEERRAIPSERQAAEADFEDYKETCLRVGLTRMSSVQPESVCWLWYPYIPIGKVTLLDGDPGLGKSYITLAMATAVSRGYGLPDRTPCDPGAVLLMSVEDGLADTIRPRLDTMKADCTRIFAVSKPLSLNRDGLGDLETLLRKNKPLFVVIDPLFAYTGAEVDIHRANETREIMDQLSRLAATNRCAILAVRHLTKGGRDKSIYRGLGSIDIVAACRSVLLAGADPQDRNKRALLQIKNNLAPFGDAIGYEIREGGVFAWTGRSDLTADQILASDQNSQKAFPVENAADFLRGELSRGPKSARDIMSRAKNAGFSERTIWRARATLGVEAHKIGRDRWVWELPSGVNAAESPEVPASQPFSEKEKQVEGLEGCQF